MGSDGGGGGGVLAVGLMSGTSLDGVDAALIETDGEGLARPIAFRSDPYSDQARQQLREATALALRYDQPRRSPEIVAATEMLTRRHVMAVHQLLRDAGVAADRIEVVGFHGQTVAHRPDRGWTWQIGDGAAMAAALGITVVDDFRGADVAAGGQGAPLLPVYHRALLGHGGPIAVLNLGGVANITYLDGETIIAFDTGPASAPIDDWVAAETGARFDAGGALAAQGSIDETVLGAMLDFTCQPARGLSAADGAATLTAFTAATVALALTHLPAPPRRIVVAGGGRHNATLMAMIADACQCRVEPIEAEGRNGDAVEAEGFAYMAVRTLRGLPISFPGTTGVSAPLTGGVIHQA